METITAKHELIICINAFNMGTIIAKYELICAENNTNYVYAKISQW